MKKVCNYMYKTVLDIFILMNFGKLDIYSLQNESSFHTH
jgi:hypothetical protein